MDQVLVVNGTNSTFGGQFAVNLNSLRKPDDTNNAYFCNGWDQVKLLYAFYQVFAVTIDMTFQDGVTPGLLAGMQIVSSKEATPTLAGTLVSVADGWTSLQTIQLTSAGTQKAQLKRTFTMAQIEGMSESEYRNDKPSYSAQVTSSPAFLPKLYYALAGFGSVVGASVISQLKVTYHCELWGLNTFAISTA